MARITPDESADGSTDAVDFLTRDHRLVDEGFASLARAAPQQLDPLARRLCKMLRIHAQIEEELFYPATRRAIDSDELVSHAEREHGEAKRAIAHIESMTSEHEEFMVAVQRLHELVVAHVRWEEDELFPRVRAARVDLVSLGATLADRRDTLMDLLGLHGDDEEGAANMRGVPRVVLRRTGALRRENT